MTNKSDNRVYTTNTNTMNNNSDNRVTTTTSTDNSMRDSSDRSIAATLSDSVVGNGTLSRTTTTNSTYAVLAASLNNGTVSGNRIRTPGGGNITSGNVTMTSSLGGAGIMQGAQNTGAGAMQQQSVALGSIVGGSGGGLSGFTGR